jgi:adenosylcobinamide kinase/adenosylcobinamide-phosphate guanylyltransferase
LNQITFVIGGCRSGKSRFAQVFAEKVPAVERIFLATCIPQDDEMKTRVAQHQKERGSHWKTVEAPIRLPEAIMDISGKERVILVDCMTLWLNNLLFDDKTASAFDDHIKKLKHALSGVQCPVVMVSNEVGMGIVPDNKLARQFRDLAGALNQDLAACSDRVAWVVAGIPVFIK